MTVLNGTFSKSQRIEIIKLFCIQSNIEVKKIVDDGLFISFHIIFKENDVHVKAILKNIVNSGWSDKPEIKRIQVPTLKNKKLNKIDNSNLTMLIGFASNGETPLIAVWNPFRYVYHDSNRSCYLLVESMSHVYDIGFYSTLYAGKNILLCTSTRFSDLLIEYINNNAW